MQHLSDEVLARLVEEEPGQGERDHLAHCASCRVELEAMREMTRETRELPELSPPPELWSRLQARLAEEEGIRASTMARYAWSRRVLRVAAALAIFAGGSATGFVARGGMAARVGEQGGRDAVSAGERLRQAESAYLAALAQYAEATGTQPVEDPLNRLAALEGIVLTTRAALEEAPADPVINGYHLTAVGQRDALLRQIEDAPRFQSAGDDQQEWF